MKYKSTYNKKLNEFEIGYIGGILDTDGCITYDTLRDRRRVNTLIRFRIIFSNNNVEFLKKVESVIGYSANWVSKKFESEITNKKSINWEIRYTHQRMILPFLKQIVDVLIVKQPRVNLAIQIMELKKNMTNNRWSDKEAECSKTIQILFKKFKSC